MFIRQTTTNSKTAGAPYTTFRLVSSERIGGKVRQQTLLNLGSAFSLPREQWAHLCLRIEQILSGQLSLLPLSEQIETLAQRYAARLLEGSQRRPRAVRNEEEESRYHEVDVESLELVRPRSVGVEHVGLNAFEQLGLGGILEAEGLNGPQRAAILGLVIARMAAPSSELAAWNWLRERSALGELLSFDYEGMGLNSLYRAADLLLKHRETIEQNLFKQIETLFAPPSTVTLYDLSNTYFEGELAGNAKAQRGHSKEKRSDCPLVTLGLVLDGNGFVRRSRMLAGNVAEAGTLEEMLKELAAPNGAVLIMDRGLATEANISWMREQGYRYLVVSRERMRQFDAEQSTPIRTASGQIVRVQRLLDEAAGELRLFCHSEARQEKESAITRRFCEKFEQGLAKLAAGLGKPHGEKNRDKLLQRLGRLQEKSRGISQHYQVELVPDPDKAEKVMEIRWEKQPLSGTMLSCPGVYCLRSNALDWDDERLWRTYIMLTDLEAVFRSLKSELGLRPVYHHKEDRADSHLFISVLAYQAVQLIRRRLKAADLDASWRSLRAILAGQQRVSAVFQQKDGRSLNIRKATTPEPRLRQIYNALGLSPSPGGLCKLLH